AGGADLGRASPRRPPVVVALARRFHLRARPAYAGVDFVPGSHGREAMADQVVVDAVFDAEALAGLRETVRGPVLTPDDPGYDEARSIWNALIDRRPAL